MSVSRIYIAGVTPERAAIRAARGPKRAKLDGWQLNAVVRRRELSRVAHYRRANAMAMGPDLGWAMVIGNLLRVLRGHVTEETLQAEAAAIGRPPIDAAAIDTAIQEIMGKAWGQYRLYTPAQAGSAIELTGPEREETGVTKIEAMDETGAARRRRQKREQMRSWRAARAAPKPTKKDIADCLGISLSTLHRMLRRGDLQIADTLSVVTSDISPLSKIDPTTENVSPGPDHAKRVIGDGA